MHFEAKELRICYDTLVNLGYSRYKVTCAEAEDLAQDTFLRAFSKIEHYDPSKGKFITWLWTMHFHLMLDKKKRKIIENTHTAVVHYDDSEVQIVDCYANRFENFEDGSKVIECVMKLSKAYRGAIVLRMVGNSYSDIAKKLKIPLGTVKTRIMRGRHILMEELCQCII